MDARWGNAIQKGLSSETLHAELKYAGPSSNLVIIFNWVNGISQLPLLVSLLLDLKSASSIWIKNLIDGISN